MLAAIRTETSERVKLRKINFQIENFPIQRKLTIVKIIRQLVIQNLLHKRTRSRF